jgi:hypothetical protein
MPRCLHQTRSGNEFSPWAPGAVARTIAPASGDFNFDHLLYEAVVREIETDSDDSEGYPFDPAVTPFSSPRALSPVPDYLSHWPVPGSSALDNGLQPSPPPLSLDPTPLPDPTAGPLKSPKLSQPREKSKYRHGSVEDIRRKKRANAKRAVKRLEHKRAAPYGDYSVKPHAINKYVRSATAIDAKLDAIKLRHTKQAYTGGRLRSNPRRVYRLDELVGEDSLFKFKLEPWDGR